MPEWISKIEIFCFAACYAITLALEVSRLFFRAPVRIAVMLGFTLVGLFAHTLYLGAQAMQNLEQGQAPLSSWFYWCLIGAWLLAAVFVVTTVRRPRGNSGLFLLPLLMALIAVAGAFGDAQPFPPKAVPFRWGLVHGLTLLLGTLTIVLGFVAGLLYLWQAYRLKHKIPTGQGFRLPSLELLQRVNVQSLYFSAGLLAIGVLSGIVLKITAPESKDTVNWSDPVVIASMVLIAWLIAAVLFELLYRPARQGQKVAYLTVASFVIFGLVVGFLLSGMTEHAPAPQTRLSTNDGRVVSLHREAGDGA
ncbi:MAG: cytochrome c biogenesis protein CcsA [Pirellulaceae bacterium]